MQIHGYYWVTLAFFIKGIVQSTGSQILTLRFPQILALMTFVNTVSGSLIVIRCQ